MSMSSYNYSIKNTPKFAFLVRVVFETPNIQSRNKQFQPKLGSKIKQLVSNFEAQIISKLSNLRLNQNLLPCGTVSTLPLHRLVPMGQP